MPRISVIIPVYNVKDYIKECVDSILAQEYIDYEIILIDDGSTDGSENVCDEYSSTYKFIEVHHQENQGLSRARNQGIRMAKGEYVLFVDSDDYISKGSLLKILETLEEDPGVDVIFLDGSKVYSHKRTTPFNEGYIKRKLYKRNRNDALAHLARLNKYPGSACSKLIKISLIIENSLYFVPGMLSEDIEWTLRLFSTANTYNYCDYDYYRYRQGRKGSITNNGGRLRLDFLVSLIRKWATFEPAPNDYFQQLANMAMAYEFIIVMANSWDLNKRDRNQVLGNLKELLWVLDTSDNRRVRIARRAISIVGFNNTAKLLNQYLKFLSRG